MNTLFPLGLSSVLLCGVLSSAYASTTPHAQLRNDRVSISKTLRQVDSHPFADSKRIMRTDRVTYHHPHLKTVSNVHDHEQVRVRCNDHVSVMMSK